MCCIEDIKTVLHVKTADHGSCEDEYTRIDKEISEISEYEEGRYMQSNIFHVKFNNVR